MKPLKRETDAVAALLKQGAPSPEELANLVMAKVDELRAERTTHTGVMRMGPGFYVAVGPFSTANQAKKALEKHPARSLATGFAIAATLTEGGLEQRIAQVDAPAAPKGDWPDVYADAAAARAKRRGR